MFNKTFKQEHTFEDRCSETKRILIKYPDRIPVVCEKANQKNLPDIDKHKYLVPWGITIGQFIYVIRKRMSLKPEEAIFLFLGNSMYSSASVIGELYNSYKDSDGFLYIQYSKENTFG
jgi:GABA(A) receptor-associated protein